MIPPPFRETHVGSTPKISLQWPRGFVARSPNFGNDARRCSLDHASGDGGGVPGRKRGLDRKVWNLVPQVGLCVFLVFWLWGMFDSTFLIFDFPVKNKKNKRTMAPSRAVPAGCSWKIFLGILNSLSSQLLCRENYNLNKSPSLNVSKDIPGICSPCSSLFLILFMVQISG